MIYFLKLHPVLGASISALLSLTFTGALFIIAHLIFGGKRPEATKTFAQQMALRIGTMHALVVALVFGLLTSELKQQHSLSDAEAISAANIYFSLKDNWTDEAAKLRSRIPQYLKTVIEQDWEELSSEPHELPAWKLISEMQSITLGWDAKTPSDVMLKGYIFNNLNTMAENRNRRIIEWRASLPPVFWAIAFLGYILTLFPYLSVELSKLRLLLVCCYAVIIGIIFYGIAVLDKPFLSGAVKPTSFEVMYNDISKDFPSSPPKN